MHAASSPNVCTTGVNIVQLIVGLLAFVDRTKTNNNQSIQIDSMTSFSFSSRKQVYK